MLDPSRLQLEDTLLNFELSPLFVAPHLTLASSDLRSRSIETDDTSTTFRITVHTTHLLTMASQLPEVIFTLPEKSLFSFPPVNVPFPQAPPPAGTPGLASPPLFTIPADIFTKVLDPKVPITIAVVYAVTVKLLNRYNRSNNKAPWAISKTRAFKAFVVLHNVFLAVYSAWTCLGMWGVLSSSIANPWGPNGPAATADSLCRSSGAPGFGEGVFFDQSIGGWTSLSDKPAVTSEGLPDPTTPGRLWNDGLAFYGWIFYLSKFYEVIDTLIILAKGKPSSTLQTYHHAGAMMAMWAGIRYMANPIWIFVFVNSGIHAMMVSFDASFDPNRTAATNRK